MTNLNMAVLFINLFTLILVLSAMGYFWMREVWLVDHLEARNGKTRPFLGAAFCSSLASPAPCLARSSRR